MGSGEQQEAWVAGESPGRVGERKSSGETTSDGEAVAAAEGKDAAGGGESASHPPVSANSARTEGRSGAEPPGEHGRDDSGASGMTSADGDTDEGGTGGDGADGPGGTDGTDGTDGPGDRRLKEAVAAWVAAPEEGDSAEPQVSEASEAPTGDGEGERSGGEAAADEESAGDQPTTMFRVVPPGSGESADSGADAGSSVTDEEAARRAERMTTAFFGAGKGEPETADSETETGAETDAEPSSAADGDASTDAEAEPEAGTGSAPEPDSAPTPESDADPESDAEPEADAEPESAPERPAGETTAIFRTDRVQRDAVSKDAVDHPTAVFRVPAEDSDERSEHGAEESGSQASEESEDAADGTSGATAAEPSATPADPRVPHARDAAPAEPEQKPAESEPASGKAEEPKGPAGDAEQTSSESRAEADEAETGAGAGAGAEAGAEADAEAGTEAGTGAAADAKADTDGDEGAEPEAQGSEESDSERTSQFVPLRSADAPPRPTKQPTPVVPPKPQGKPHPPGGPPQAQPLPEESTSGTQQLGRPGQSQQAAPSGQTGRTGQSQTGQTGQTGQAGQTTQTGEPEPPRLSEAELTRQQPRPDQAPLDLLAQLTNTPPPPETPLRMVARRVKIWTPLVVLLAIVVVVVQALRPLPDPALTLTASSAYEFQGQKPAMPWPSEGQASMDVEGLGSLGSSGSQKPVPIASVAKVMTAYVILHDHPGSDGKHITVDKKAEDEAGLSAQNESTVKVKKGDKITEREAVQALLIASANNVARLLARWDAGSEGAFTKKMNRAAKKLGMTHTRYTDPSGLTASTVSTAQDQVKLAKKAMDSPLFRQTVRMPSYTDTKGKKHPNWNKLVPVDGVVGIKTGTTTKAGGNLLFAAEKNIGGTKQLIVGAVLGQHKPSILDTVLGASKRLVDAGQDALRTRKVVHKGDVVGYADDQLGGRTPVVATKDVSAVGWSGLKVKLATKGSAKGVPHEAEAGDTVGSLTVGHGPGQVRVPVALKKDMTEPGFGAKLTRIL